ncbi:MAG: tRNA pseudouridine(55) synthase TruB [Oscillospiraceae bacterium]|nr:tRNA pseudouridine(55) synthase TruB [Oscillospiraceae bacterium]
MPSGILIVDKPRDWTSFDVVAKLRRIYAERRVGHSGTLDPLATGVLAVFLGRATRAIEFCEADDKEYLVRMRCGLVTDTQDITGNVIRAEGGDVSSEELAELLPEFTGPQTQIPPMYSAVKMGGKKLYELARQGRQVERRPREIEIKTLELLGREDGDFILRAVCSKGTYIRTLCHDMGERLGCGAVMSGLRRTRAGSFSIAEAVTIEKVIKAAERGSAESLLRHVDSVFMAYPAVTVDAEGEKRCRNGNDIPIELDKDGLYRVYNGEGAFLMLGSYRQGFLFTEKSFFEV